jgi:hypothetical protein
MNTQKDTPQDTHIPPVLDYKNVVIRCIDREYKVGVGGMKKYHDYL